MPEAVIVSTTRSPIGRAFKPSLSYTGPRGNPGQANYATAKAGTIGFTKTAAKELAPFGVTVSAISSNAETRTIGSIPADKKPAPTATIPLGRFAQPAEMPAGVGLLGSEGAGQITGAVAPVDDRVAIWAGRCR